MDGGLYVGDAIVWLQPFKATASFQRLGRLGVAPVLAPGSSHVPVGETTEVDRLSIFGFGADGPMSNGTYVFDLVAFVVYAIVHETIVPPLLVELLQAIPVHRTRQDSTSARMAERMLTSAVQITVNRSMDDPLLLAAELARHVPSATASGVGGTASGVITIRHVAKSTKHAQHSLRLCACTGSQKKPQ